MRNIKWFATAPTKTPTTRQLYPVREHPRKVSPAAQWTIAAIMFVATMFVPLAVECAGAWLLNPPTLDATAGDFPPLPSYAPR